MRPQASLVATLTTLPSLDGVEFGALPEDVQWLEVRADLVGDISPDWLRQHFRGRLLYTLKSRVAGGADADAGPIRQARLRRAAASYDLIALEAEHDLLPDLLQAVPPQKRLISWYGPATDARRLKHRFQQLSTFAARLYQLVPWAMEPGEALAPLEFLHALKRLDIIAYAAGPAGFWSRLLAPRFGAPLVFGNLGDLPSADAAPTIDQLQTDYGLPDLLPLKALYGIAGSPVAHSLSPRLHNAAYRALGYPALYLPFEVQDFTRFWHAVVKGETLTSLGIPLQGVTVISPHKEQAQALADGRSALVGCTGASSLCVRHHGHWRAEATEAAGVLQLLDEHGVQVVGQRVAVVGCGGSGRTVAVGLTHAGAEVTLFNRGHERGIYASKRLDLPYMPLADFSADDFDIVVNATSVGRDDHALPFPLAGLDAEAAVVDLVYGAAPTPLMAATGDSGRVIISGLDVLLTQVHRQFRLMTGKDMPPQLAQTVLGWDVEACDAVSSGLHDHSYQQ